MTITCPSCSYKVDADSKYCTYCDTPLKAITAPKGTADTTTNAVRSVSGQISALLKRYTDAYVVARVIDGVGGIIKIMGVTAGVLLLLVGVIIAANGRPGDATFAIGVLTGVFGVVAGVLFYLLGLIVSAQAQILKATLDSAVNSSPFLTNDDRAQIMSLPTA